MTVNPRKISQCRTCGRKLNKNVIFKFTLWPQFICDTCRGKRRRERVDVKL